MRHDSVCAVARIGGDSACCGDFGVFLFVFLQMAENV
jgi:hypothetical protein